MFYSILSTIFGLGNDVYTVTGGTVGNAGSAAAEMVTYMSAKTLEVAVTTTVLDQFGDKQPLPANSSKTIRFTRIEKFATTASPTQLTEGTAPDAVGATINQYEATVEQYGFVAIITDLAELTARHPIVQKVLSRMGLHAAETYDQLIFNVIDAATSNYRPNGRANDASLVAGDLIGYTDLVNLLSTLQSNAGMPVKGANYVLVCPPQVNAGFLRDADWKASNQFRAPEKIWNGQTGALANFDVVVSNAPSFAATTQTASGKANKVYSSFGIARDAYQITDLQSLEVIVTPPGGHSDRLKQKYGLGYKFSAKSLISNQNWIQRVRSAGVDSVNS